MNLSPDRFLQGSFTYRDAASGAFVSVPMYSYESKDALYDLAVVNGGKMVRVNCGPWSNRIDAWKPVHYAILNHFNLR